MPIVPHSTRLHTIFIGPLQVVDAMQGRLRLRERIRDGHQRQRLGRAVEVIRQLGHVLARDARVYGGHKTRLAPSRMSEVHYSGSVALPYGRPRLLAMRRPRLLRQRGGHEGRATSLQPRWQGMEILLR